MLQMTNNHSTHLDRLKVVLVIYVFLNGYVTRLHLHNEMYILDNSSDLGTTSKIRIAISFKIKHVPAGTF
jgi:hypothetical protein